MRRNARKTGLPVAAVALLAAVAVFSGCSGKEVRNEVVATANGEPVTASELREFLGFRGGTAAATGVPAEKKREAIDRLIAGRLLAQEARAMGLDNTGEFRSAVAGNEQGVWINALLRKEIESKVKVEDSEVGAEAKKMRGADNNLKEADALMRAAQAVSERQIRSIEENIVSAAKKEFPVVLDNAALRRVEKGEALDDAAVLATAGGENVTFGQVRKVLAGMSPGGHGSRDFTRNPVAVQRVLDREATGRSLVAYAKKQGLEGTQWLKSVRADMERAILINLLAEKVTEGAAVSEKEIAQAYAEHEQMLVRDGKKVPLAQVKEQLRSFLENGKRRKILEERLESLKKKAKITVNDGLLPKV